MNVNGSDGCCVFGQSLTSINTIGHKYHQDWTFLIIIVHFASFFFFFFFFFHHGSVFLPLFFLHFFLFFFIILLLARWTKFIVVVNFSASRPPIANVLSLSSPHPPTPSPSLPPPLPVAARSETIQRSLGTVPKFRIAWDDIAAIPAAIRA